jgi:hypothetical protein
MRPVASMLEGGTAGEGMARQQPPPPSMEQQSTAGQWRWDLRREKTNER